MVISGYRGSVAVGRGGFAEVFAATAADGRRVAIKVFARAGDVRIEREVEALRRAAGAHVPALLERLVLGGGREALVQELIEGPDLRVRAGVGHEVAIEALAAAAVAVDAVHRAGVAHRDLKPEHILFRGDGTAVLIDFGLARVDETEDAAAVLPGLTHTGERAGTAAYMAPEQCRGESGVGAAADIYAFGVIAFELLVGRRPFEGGAAELQRQHAFVRPPAASALSGVPAAVDAVFERVLAKMAAGRPATAGEVVVALREALAGKQDRGGDVRPPVTPEREAPGARADEREMALLAVRTGAALETLQAASDGAVIARAEQGLVVLGFAELTPERGVGAAVLLGERLVRDLHVPAAVVHVAPVRVRRRRGKVVLASDAVVAAEAWSGGASTGVVLTEQAASWNQRAGAVRAGDHGFWSVQAMDTIAAPLVGRQGLLDELQAACGATGIVTVIGEAGTGTSRLLEELAARCRGRVIRVAPAETLLAPLACAALGCNEGSLAGALALAALEPDERAALGLALGLPSSTQTTPGQPGLLRERSAAALAALLRMAADRPLVILVDDLHRADAAAIDALELVTARDRSPAIAVCATAGPELEALRPGWGGRAVRARRFTLEPLTDAEAATVLRALLGAEFVPDAVIDRLVARAGGRPLHLAEVAHALRAAGVVRAADAGRALIVAADELAAAEATPLGERVARQLLSTLSPDLARLARACAVLGGPIAMVQVDALQRRAAGSWVDAASGLERLTASGLLRAVEGGRYRFRHDLIRGGIEAATDRDERAALHRAALEAIDPGWPDALDRLARHAEACGERTRAAEAWLRIAGRERRGHREVDAEIAFGAALRHLEPDDPRRIDALAGRAAMRYRIQRFADARADAVAGRELAEALGDRRRTVELLLLEATIRDWLFDLEASAARAEAALALAAELDGDELEAPLALASGRTAYRREQLDEAIAELTRATEIAQRRGDRQTAIMAMLLLAPALLYAGRLDAAEARYADVIDACRREADDAHLAAAHNNRQLLWLHRQRLDRAAADLRTTVDLSRKLGNAQIERVATHNLAEILYWRGETEEPLALARHSRRLQRDLTGDDLVDDALLVARIAVAAGDRETAAVELRAACERGAELGPSAAMLAELVRLRVEGGAREQWDALYRRAGTLPLADLSLEVCLAAAEEALRSGTPADAGHWIATARSRLAAGGSWHRRFAALA